ncbi:MAG: hypothetical protein Q7T82_21560 [Armatimonadota bacterium]|nr:hypothetical protein [Armatimonadota bacterium]
METTTDQPDTGPDPSHYDRREAVLTEIIMSLPELLAKCEEFQAATIVAGLLKAHMARRAPGAEPAEDLDAIVLKAASEADADSEDDY